MAVGPARRRQGPSTGGASSGRYGTRSPTFTTLPISSDPLRWLDTVETEHDNLRAALSWCSERGVETGFEIAGYLVWFWDSHCHFREGSQWAAELLARSSDPTIARARALRTAAQMACGLDAWGEATALAEESVRLCRALGSQLDLGRSLGALAHTLSFPDEEERRQRLLTEAIPILRAEGDLFELSCALWELIDSRTDPSRARGLVDESLAIAREIGYVHGAAYRLLTLAWLELPDGDVGRARSMLEEALVAFRREKHTYAIGHTLLALALVAIVESDLGSAMEHLAESLRLYQEIGGGPNGLILEVAGEIAVRTGNHIKGARLFGSMAAYTGRVARGYRSPVAWAYDAAVAEARDALGDELFARAWAEGQAMTLEQAVEHALSEPGV